MSDDQQVTAELEFQARLATLHDARARLASLEAALHRLAIDRPTMAPGEAEIRESELAARRARASEEVAALHAAARRAHTTLRRLTDPDAEPDDLDSEDLDPGTHGDGYQQPPFAESN